MAIKPPKPEAEAPAKAQPWTAAAEIACGESSIPILRGPCDELHTALSGAYREEIGKRLAALEGVVSASVALGLLLHALPEIDRGRDRPRLLLDEGSRRSTTCAVAALRAMDDVAGYLADDVRDRLCDGACERLEAAAEK